MKNKLNITPEQRLEYAAKASVAREKKKIDCANVRTEYADTNHWRELASKYGVRLPTAYFPASEIKYVKKAAKKVGLDVKEFVEFTGCKNLKEFASLNPNWSALAMVGLYLEFADENKA